MTIVPAPGREELLQRLTSLKGAALFLGRSDSGKTTLVRYLLAELAAREVPVALNHRGETRAPGVVNEADAEALTVLTALSSLRGIDRVVLGDFGYEAGLRSVGRMMIRPYSQSSDQV